MLGYLGGEGYHDHAHHMRVGGLREVQITTSVYPKVVASLDELANKKPQRLK